MKRGEEDTNHAIQACKRSEASRHKRRHCGRRGHLYIQSSAHLEVVLVHAVRVRHRAALPVQRALDAGEVVAEAQRVDPSVSVRVRESGLGMHASDRTETEGERQGDI